MIMLEPEETHLLNRRRSAYELVRIKEDALTEVRREFVKTYLPKGSSVQWKRGKRWYSGFVVDHAEPFFNRIKVSNEKTGNSYWIHIYETTEDD